MIRFGSPQFLYLLLLVPLLAMFLIWSWKRRQQAMKKFASLELSERLMTDVSRRRQKIKNVLLLSAVALALFSLARPQYGYKWEDVKRRGVDIMIAVDLSKSMLSEDVLPSRMERARRKIIDLLDITKGDRIGLIGFAGSAFVLTPLTLDYSAVRLFADELSPDLVPVPSTALAEAIELATKSLSKGNPESRGLVIMSDGEDMGGDVLEMAKKAGESGIKIYTLGIGTADGAPIRLPKGGFQKDDKGELVLTKLDEKMLMSIAGATGGRYVRSVSNDKDLAEIYKGIQGELEDMELKGGRRKLYIDRYQWFLSLALIALAIEVFMRETKKKRRFWKKWFALVCGLILLFWSANSFTFGTTGTIREGEELYRAGKYDEALQKFLSAQVEQPNDIRLKYNIANTYYKLQQYDKAVELFNSISDKSNNKLKERSVYNRGNSEYKSGDLKKAIDSYENALKLDPNDEDARYNLEFVKKELEKQQQQQQSKQEEKKGAKEGKKEEGNKNEEKKEGGETAEQKNEVQKGESANKEKGQEGEQQEGEKGNFGASDEKKDDEENKEGEGQGMQGENGAMNKQEASRWLSTIKEGKRKVYSQGMKGSGTHKGVKDW